MKKLIETLKEKLEGWDGADDLKDVVGQIEKQMGGNALTRLFRKRGEFSITRTILIGAWVFGLLLYVVGSLFAGASIEAIALTVPAFDSGNFLAITGAASTLYYANHNVKYGKG